MNIGIIGSGGREHAICYKINKSNPSHKIYCFPGNAGTSKISTNVLINPDNFDELYDFVIKKNIDLIIVGPENSLVNGIVDFFENKNIMIFGPNKKASKLEGSKIFMKDFCIKNKIPTAKYIEVKDLKSAQDFLITSNFPVVVKSDGLAAGKGVTICNNTDEVLKDVKRILDGKFKSSKKVIIEEFLKGEEASYFVITDGINFKNIGTAQDHKRVGEGDIGLNTGGMGAYSPSYLIDDEVEEKIVQKIIKPTIDGMRKMGTPYRGILYAGLMIHDKEPKLIEYNIRFGDPECQVLMLRMKSQLLDIILSVFDNTLKEQKIIWEENPGITIVAASKGYPESFKNNVEIKNLENLKLTNSKQIFHAGTIKNEKGKILSNGGRVLNSTVVSETLKNARIEALDLLDQLDWENKYYRRDIGFRVIKK